jgi:hypothetical protein
VCAIEAKTYKSNQQILKKISLATMDRFEMARRDNKLGINRCIRASERSLNQPFHIFEDNSAEPLSITTDLWATDSNPPMQSFLVQDDEKPWLYPYQVWLASHGAQSTTNPAKT